MIMPSYSRGEHQDLIKTPHRVSAGLSDVCPTSGSTSKKNHVSLGSRRSGTKISNELCRLTGSRSVWKDLPEQQLKTQYLSSKSAVPHKGLIE
jgi:hypothetical protein